MDGRFYVLHKHMCLCRSIGIVRVVLTAWTSLKYMGFALIYQYWSLELYLSQQTVKRVTLALCVSPSSAEVAIDGIGRS